EEAREMAERVKRAGLAVERRLVDELVLHGADMLAEIFADAGAIEHDIDAGRLQHRPGADAGAHQQGRAADRTRADDHLAARRHAALFMAAANDDAGGPALLDDDALHLTVRQDGEVGAFARGAEIGFLGAAAPAVALRRDREERAFHFAAIIFGER